MDYLMILAQTATNNGRSYRPDRRWEQITSIILLEALTFISFGVVACSRLALRPGRRNFALFG
jgi:hypothetical protein